MRLRGLAAPPAADPPAVLRDFALPPGFPPPAETEADAYGLAFRTAGWTPEGLAALAARLAGRGAEALRALADSDLLAAWSGTVEAFLDPASPERRGLEPALARLCRLSFEGLAAGLEAVLGGVRRHHAEALFSEASVGEPRPLRNARSGPVLVILASNLPALAVQPLLPSLALRRPVLLKSPSSEPLFAPALTAALSRREPALGEAVAAVTWPGGDVELEGPLLAAAGTIVAYGEDPTLADLERRAPGRVVGYGAKASFAAVGADAEPDDVAPGLARDVALFDQRGCLSVHAVYTAGDPEELAVALARALAERAASWPPGPIDAALAAAVQQVRAEAALRGLFHPDFPLSAGTVVVEPRPELRPSPGLRTVRVHPLADLTRLPRVLAPWRSRLQGAALAGADAWAVAPELASLGVSRCAPPGELQTPDALWHNGGRHPLEPLR